MTVSTASSRTSIRVSDIRQRRTACVVLTVMVIGVLSSGCSTFLVSSNDRIDRCVAKQRQIYGEKHTVAEYVKACGKWESLGQLADDGTWQGQKK